MRKLLTCFILSFNFAACSSSNLGGVKPSLDVDSDFNNSYSPNNDHSLLDKSISVRAASDMRVLSRQNTQGVYKIGPSDLLEIKVFQADELSRQVRVSKNGGITLPLLGSVRVSGLTQVELENRLATLLGQNLLRDPQVSVFIKEFTAQRFTVEGEVKNQGVFPMSGDVTILQAIAMAGGVGELASVEDVILFRKINNVTRDYMIDLNAIRSGQASDPILRNDDRIVISRLEEKSVTVDGEVNRPGVFPYAERMTVLQAVALAEGLSNLASPERVAVLRRVNGEEKIYSVNLNAIRQGEAPDPFVKSSDRIVVHRSNSRYWLKEIAPLLSPLSALTSILSF